MFELIKDAGALGPRNYGSGGEGRAGTSESLWDVRNLLPHYYFPGCPTALSSSTEILSHGEINLYVYSVSFNISNCLRRLLHGSLGLMAQLWRAVVREDGKYK